MTDSYYISDDCDCLNDCGDDPRLCTGRVQPCQWLLDRRADWDAQMTSDRAIALLDAGKLQELWVAIIELGQMADRWRGNRP